MKLTEKQLKKIIKESVLNAMKSEGFGEENKEGEVYTVAPRIASELSDYLYSHSRKADYFRRVLNSTGFFNCDTNNYGEKTYSSIPNEIVEGFTEVIESIEASINAAKLTLMEIVKSGLLSDYQKGEALKALQSADKALNRD